MTDQEVNKIIAEFIGWEFIDYDEPQYENTPISGYSLYDPKDGILYGGLYFTKSLDSLVSVWEKLGLKIIPSLTMFFGDMGIQIDFKTMTSDHKTIQQAAAHATAKAILELKSD